MTKLTQKEREVLNDLQSAVAACMRSKPKLHALSSLLAKGMIEWDPLGGTAKLTAYGEQHLQ